MDFRNIPPAIDVATDIVPLTKYGIDSVLNYHRSIMHVREKLDAAGVSRTYSDTPSIYIGPDIMEESSAWIRKIGVHTSPEYVANLVTKAYIKVIGELSGFDVFYNDSKYVSYEALAEGRDYFRRQIVSSFKVKGRAPTYQLYDVKDDDVKMISLGPNGKVSDNVTKIMNDGLNQNPEQLEELMDDFKSLHLDLMYALAYIHFQSTLSFEVRPLKRYTKRGRPQTKEDVSKPYVIVYMDNQVKEYLEGVSGKSGITRSPHKRRAHTRTLRAERFKDHPLYMIPDAIPVRESWPGDKVFSDKHYIYKMREHKKES